MKIFFLKKILFLIKFFTQLFYLKKSFRLKIHLNTPQKNKSIPKILWVVHAIFFTVSQKSAQVKTILLPLPIGLIVFINQPIYVFFRHGGKDHQEVHEEARGGFLWHPRFPQGGLSHCIQQEETLQVFLLFVSLCFYNRIQYSTIQYNTVQYSTVQ